MVNFKTNRTFSVGGPALPDVEGIGPMLHLSAMRGTEQLSTPYTYELWLTTPADPQLPAEILANLDLKAMLGKELTVTIQLDGMGSFVAGMAGQAGAANRGAGTREISGIVTAASYVDQLNRQCRYRVVLEPWLALARERTDYRIFQRKSVLDILREVFGSYWYSFEMRVGRTYRPLRYQVQYGESDFAFAQRLMEEHGIAWFFEHSQGVHRLVLVDGPGAYRSVESVAYQTLEYYPPGRKIDREHVDRFEATERLRSGVWTTDDFDFEKPGATLTAQNSLPRETAHNQLERYEWPGRSTCPIAARRRDCRTAGCRQCLTAGFDRVASVEAADLTARPDCLRARSASPARSARRSRPVPSSSRPVRWPTRQPGRWPASRCPRPDRRTAAIPARPARCSARRRPRRPTRPDPRNWAAPARPASLPAPRPLRPARCSSAPRPTTGRDT